MKRRVKGKPPFAVGIPHSTSRTPRSACRDTVSRPPPSSQCNPLDAQHHASSDRLLVCHSTPNTPPHPPFLLSGTLGAGVGALHISLWLVRSCFPSLRQQPIRRDLFLTRHHVIRSALPQTPGSHVGPALALAGGHTQMGNGATVQPDQQMPRTVDTRRPCHQACLRPSMDTGGAL
ncbi:hypothetical protein N658DRAFT_187688 [Parathielavia hyrcaniae]|uniref:Uncharacterized protein n=1 Tax=Parathielavia hyrcaniae TaxID=113614 RepID=A0AAN6T592_9PEZI|nr:hypothetical protein N658DRAFT_187688 [Parathielavia hyrcaniae]